MVAIQAGQDGLVRPKYEFVDVPTREPADLGELIHDPDEHGEQALREAYTALEQLRAEGRLRAIGVGMNRTRMLTTFVKNTDVDVVLVAGRYTLLDQSATSDLLPAAIERGVAVLAAAVFNSGLLAAPHANASYDYRATPANLVTRARRLEQICAEFGVPLRAAAARLPMRHPAVASVVIGARSAAEVADAVSLWQAEISAALWGALDFERGRSCE